MEGLQINLKQPVLSRVFRSISERMPSQACRGAEALASILEGVYRSPWQEVAWAFSPLTGDGFPVEFAFSSQDETVRYTAEAAGPETAPILRLKTAETLMEKIGAGPLPEKQRILFGEIQEAGTPSLEYGVWIGGRHDLKNDRYKLYIEIPDPAPPAANELVCSLLGSPQPLSTRRVKLRMIGFEPHSSRMEIYFGTEYLEPWEVGAVLRRVGLHSRTSDLLDFIGEVYGRPFRETLPGAKHGFSFSLSPGGGEAAASVFMIARSLGGGDGSIRKRLLWLARRMGWGFLNYSILSKPLEKRDEWRTYHGMVAFIVSLKGPPILHIGLRPV